MKNHGSNGLKNISGSIIKVLMVVALLFMPVLQIWGSSMTPEQNAEGVVEVETGTYVADVLTPDVRNNNIDGYNTVTGIVDQEFIIVSETLDYALTSTNYVVDGDRNHKVKGMRVLEADRNSNPATITVSADKRLLWRMEGTGHTGTVYVRAVDSTDEEPLYLNIITEGILTVSSTKQEIYVVTNGSGQVGFCAKVNGEYYYVEHAGGKDAFHVSRASHGLEDAGRRFVLAKYAEDSYTEAVTGARTYPVDTDALGKDMAYVIAGVNLDKQGADDAVIMRSEATGNQQFLTGGNGDGDLILDSDTKEVQYVALNGNNTVENSLWLLESGEDEDDSTYYVKSLAEEQYLRIYHSSNGSYKVENSGDYNGDYTYVGLEKEPQKIYVTDVANEEADEVQGAKMLYAFPRSSSTTGYYMVLPTNVMDDNFYAIPRGENNATEMGHRGLHMYLDAYGQLIDGLDGKGFLIAGVNNGSGLNAGLMTGTTRGNGLESVGVNAAITDKKVMSLPADEQSHAVWIFEDAGMLGTYYVKHSVSQQYLNINEDGTVTLSAAKQKIEAVVADLEHNTHNEAVQKNVVSLRAAGTRYYLNLDGNNTSNPFLSYACPTVSHVANRGNHLVLMEYERSTELATNLGDKVYYVAAVNNTVGEGEVNFPVMSSAMVSGSNHLVGQNLPGDNLGWRFQESGISGVYHIQAVNGANAGKYLRITESGITLADSPQGIEVLAGIPGNAYDTHFYANPICLRGNVNGTYYYVNLINNLTNGDFSSHGGTDAGAGDNHLALVEIRDVNMLLGKIRQLLDNLVPVVGSNGDVTGYEFSDAAYYGSALPDNANEGQQGASNGKANPTFVDDYDQAVAYRREMQTLARQIRQIYEELPESGQRYIYNYKELDKMTWLWEAMETVPADDVNATVRLFNYDSIVNQAAGGAGAELLDKGFQFYHKSQYDYYTAVGAETRNNTNNLGAGNSGSAEQGITFAEQLSENGYPVISGGIVGGSYQTVTEGSMEYLFDDTFRQAEMDNGGGLFQQDDEGYYYYYSNQNAASYNSEANRFDLYDTVIRPMYIHGKLPNEANDVYNFLPFNTPYEDAIFDPSNTIPSNTVGTTYTDVDGVTKENKAKSEANTRKSAYLNERTDVWFGMNIEMEFLMPANGKVTAPDGTEQDMIFEFYGDDDVLVYIDDTLVIDLGGTHSAEFGSVNFTTGEVTDTSGNTKSLQSIFGLEGNTFDAFTFHTLKFFYLERGGNVSYAGIKFNLADLPEHYLAVEKQLDYDDSYGENPPEISADQYYTFRVIQAKEDGTPIYNAAGEEQSFFETGTEYEIWKDGEPVLNPDGSLLTGVIDGEGYFSVRQGYTAMFPKMLYYRANSNCTHYILQEILPRDETGQYSKVEHVVTKVGDTSEPVTTTLKGESSGAGRETDQEDVVYNGSHVDVGQGSTISRMVNRVTGTLGRLQIRKQAASGTIIGADEVFEIYIQFGDEVLTGSGMEKIWHPIATGTKYTLTGSTGSMEKLVEKEGYITLRVDETITIEGILAGTLYHVEEVGESAQKYIPSYTGTAAAAGTRTLSPLEEDGISGEFKDVKDALIVVENRANEPSVEIHGTTTLKIRKQLMGSMTTETFQFTAIIEPPDGGGVRTESFEITVDPDVGEESYVLRDIPIGSTVKVQENGAEDYRKSYQITAGFEAEFGSLSGEAKIVSDAAYAGNASGGAYVENIAENNQVEIEPVSGTSGEAELKFYYETSENGAYKIMVNDTAYTVSGLYSGSEYAWPGEEGTAGVVTLNGDDTISFGGDGGNAPNLDYFTLAYPKADGDTATLHSMQGPGEITFVNRATHVLPESGGRGIVWHILWGSALMLGPVLYKYKKMEGMNDYEEEN